MREVDQALARGYAADRPPSTDPPVPPAPHFAIDPAPRGARSPEAGFRWPETVLSLEKAHGDRFDRLADAVTEARQSRNVRLLLFISGHRAEGRTTLVLALARAMARRPGRTLLLDGDLTGPMLARQLGARPRIGLDDVIDRDLAVADALIEAPDDHLTLLPLRAPVSRPREFFASDGWTRLMGRIRTEFDSVLIDGGPVLSGLSAAILPRAVDAAILVVRPSLADDRAMVRARKALDAAGIPLLGLAETFC